VPAQRRNQELDSADICRTATNFHGFRRKKLPPTMVTIKPAGRNARRCMASKMPDEGTTGDQGAPDV